MPSFFVDKALFLPLVFQKFNLSFVYLRRKEDESVYSINLFDGNELYVFYWSLACLSYSFSKLSSDMSIVFFPFWTKSPLESISDECLFYITMILGT